MVPPLKGRHMRTRSVAVAVSALLVAAPVAYAPSANGQGNDSSLTASSLRADYRVDPLGIDDATPDLSWTVASRQRDQVQTAYEVRAATSEPGLSQPDLWDTGRVTSAQSTDVVYAGAAVHSRLRVFWQLRVWDASGRASAWSPTAFWEMGLQSSSDWQAKWITDKRYSPPEPHPVMVHVPPQDARYLKLDVTKLGLPLKEGFPSPVSRLQLAEIAVTDSSDASGADLARGAAVTASESYTVNGYWEPRFVTDGALTTQQPPLGYTSYQRYSQDLTSPIWLQLDLGAVKHFDEVLLYPRTDTLTADGQTPNFPVDYSLATAQSAAGPFNVVSQVTDQQPPPPYQSTPPALPLLAKQFTLDKPVRSARLYAIGLGVYAASINGSPVSRAVLEPGNTDYAARVDYATYDVSNLVRQGDNAIGIQLGNGNYNLPSTPGRYEKFVGSSGQPKALAQLEVTFTDGTHQMLGTDATWHTTLGPTTFSNWYGGEDFDARRVQPDWDRPGADLSAWQPAVTVDPPAPGTALTAQAAPPIQVVDTLHPVAITQPKPGIYVADFGVNFAGWEQLSASGPAGTTITMRPGELLNSDGTVSQSTTGSPIYDRFTLDGGPAQTWHPQFAYHGFRYLQLEGLTTAPTKDSLTGLVLRTANDNAGSFDSSNVLLDKIHTIIDRAIQSNMYSVLTDCPHREKLGWLEEDQLVFDSVARNYDVAAYYRTLVRNMADAQTANGLVPDIAPEYTVFGGGFRDDPNWGGAMVLAPLNMYETYGDVGTLRTYYPNMVRYADYLAGKATNNLLSYGLGDWIAFDKSTPLGITATFGYYRIVQALARIATVLGRPADATRWTTLAANIASSFNTAFLDPVRHTYGSGSQAGDAMALDMGVVPDDQRQAVLDHLIGSIQAKGWHLTVGEIALPSVFRVLSAAGRDDIVYDIATQTGNPSYGYQVVHGATSLTENWDGPTSGNSQNHFMLGAIDQWFTSGLAGIKQAADSVAYHDLVIKPAVVGDLSHVSGSYATPYGQVSSAWERDGRSFHLDVTVPANTTATVYVPVLRGSNASATAGARLLRTEDGYAVYAVGSGRWQFTSVTNGTVPPVTGQLSLSAPASGAAVVPGVDSTATLTLHNLTDTPLTAHPTATASAGFTASVPSAVTVPANGDAALPVHLAHVDGGPTDGSVTVQVGDQSVQLAVTVTDDLVRVATMSASSTYGSFSAAAAGDGDTRAQHDFAVWNGGSGWNDNTARVFPDTLTATWVQPVHVGHVRVLTLDAPGYPASSNGLRDYDVQALVNGSWTTVGSVRGNTAGTVDTTFAPVDASAIRLVITDTNDHAYSRVVELEAFPS